MSILNYFKKASSPIIDPEDKGDSDIEVPALTTSEMMSKVGVAKKYFARSRAQCKSNHPPIVLPSILDPPLNIMKGGKDFFTCGIYNNKPYNTTHTILLKITDNFISLLG